MYHFGVFNKKFQQNVINFLKNAVSLINLNKFQRLQISIVQLNINFLVTQKSSENQSTTCEKS